MELSLLWVPATLAAAMAQTARNALQRGLTETLGTIGATQVRFVFGLPFALIFLAVVAFVTGERLPAAGPGFLPFVLLGALAQIGATALMLAAMRERSFSVVTAYVKTEPVQTAVFGLVVLGEPLTGPMLAAILVATAGVFLVSYRPGLLTGGGLRPVLLGIMAGGLFGLAAIGFRGGILALTSGSFLIKATTTLVVGLAIQTIVLALWLALFDRSMLLKLLQTWRSSVGAGFLGALASQFWFIGFALTSAANVRTLALVEIIMAQIVSRRLFSQTLGRREGVGLAAIVAGVALLLATSA